MVARPPMPSQKSIAQRLNVHVTLVSKVLSGRMGTSGVSDEMAERIRETAREMGYQKNQNAAALRSGSQQVVAAFIDRRFGAAGSGLIEQIVAGISVGTRAHQQRQAISFYNSLEEFRMIAETLHPGAADGVIVTGVRDPGLPDEVLRLQAKGTPVVTVFNNELSSQIPNVKMSDEAIGKLATQHLIERGRRRILHVSCSREREAGYFEALAEADIARDPMLVHYENRYSNYTRAMGERAVQQAFAEGVEFDAVSAQSDTQALGAMYALIRRGVRVPEDVMITGVDDSPLAREAYVPLTSVNQRFEERGKMSVSLLSKLILGEPAKVAVVAPKLSIRESTGSLETAVSA